MSPSVTRRTFLAAAGAVAVASIGPAQAARPGPTGTVSGRTGPRGIRAGTADRPSRAEVVLLDGRALEVAHTTSWRIGPHKGVVLAPDGQGRWSILYAEA